ncbi:hypothetical protein D3C78_1412970 [compost metagenome]
MQVGSTQQKEKKRAVEIPVRYVKPCKSAQVLGIRQSPSWLLIKGKIMLGWDSMPEKEGRCVGLRTFVSVVIPVGADSIFK